ncbi:MAG TPA: hypothetical protein VM327_10460 [Candidatus Thermoplasmatota archaeon]|nr:hypothetical protein [Candidatus Thermoplasmatota archaeon]
MLLRLALRPDRALLVAALGTAAAILLPVASTLVLAGITTRIEDGWIAYPVDADGSLDLAGLAGQPPMPTLVVAVSASDPLRMAYIVGEPIVERGSHLAMPFANVEANVTRSADTLPLVRDDAVLVHPDDLGPSRAAAALFSHRPTLPGTVVAPTRGADAFELATTAALRDQGLALVVLSIPAVCLVAYVFARQEVRAQARRAATLSALGGHRVALAVLAGRTFLMAALAGLIAMVVGATLYSFGPPLFHPDDAPRLRLAVALAVPTAAAALGGLLAVWQGARGSGGGSGDVLRGAGRDVEDDVPVRLPFSLRPLLVGLRLFPILVLAAALFVADVGFPIAAAQTPASLAGGDGEWVIGADKGLAIGAGIDARVADVAGLDPHVDAIVAETILPTLLSGQGLILRGGDWGPLADYHGLELAQGRAPGPDEIAVGKRVAGRHGWGIGDRLTVLAAGRPEVRILEVVAIVDAEGPEADEGFVDAETGQALAGLPRGQANVIRFRPETEAARAAVVQQAPNIVVTSVSIEPDRPVTGSVASAIVETANLGAQSGGRTLTVRLNGDPIATGDVSLGPHSRTRSAFPFIVPEGAVVVEVNPSTSDAAQPAEAEWAQEGTPLAGQQASFRLTQGGAAVSQARAALYHNLTGAAADTGRLLEGTTDGEGRIRFVLPVKGAFVVATLDEPRVFLEGHALVEGSGVIVSHVWTVPGTVLPGTMATLYGRLENPTTRTLEGEVNATVGELMIGSGAYRLGPGEATTVAFPLFYAEPVASVAVGNRTLDLTAAIRAGAPAGLPTPSPQEAPLVRPGTGVQTQVAGRILGDARQALVGLGGCALVSTLAVVYLATQRTLAGRRHVAGLLEALGQDRDRIRSRAALEGTVLGAVALLAVAIPAKLAFQALAAWGPAVFAHALPDPVGPLFTLQAAAAFAGACAWAAYLAAGRH